MWCIAIDEGAWICGVGCLSPLHLQPLAQVQVTTWYPKLVCSCFPKIDWKLNDLEINHELKQHGERRQIFFWRRMELARRAGCCYRVVEWSWSEQGVDWHHCSIPIACIPAPSISLWIDSQFLGSANKYPDNFQNILTLDTEEKSQQNVKLQNSKPMSSVWVQVAFQSMVSNVHSAILHVMNVV